MTKHVVEARLEAFCNTCKEWKLGDSPAASYDDVVKSAKLHSEDSGHMVTITGYTRPAGKVNDLRQTIGAMATSKLLELYEGRQLTFSTRVMVLEEIQKRVAALPKEGQ